MILKVLGLGDVPCIGNACDEFIGILYDGMLVGFVCLDDQISVVAVILPEINRQYTGNAAEAFNKLFIIHHSYSPMI